MEESRLYTCVLSFLYFEMTKSSPALIKACFTLNSFFVLGIDTVILYPLYQAFHELSLTSTCLYNFLNWFVTFKEELNSPIFNNSSVFKYSFAREEIEEALLVIFLPISLPSPLDWIIPPFSFVIAFSPLKNKEPLDKMEEPILEISFASTCNFSCAYRRAAFTFLNDFPAFKSRIFPAMTRLLTMSSVAWIPNLLEASISPEFSTFFPSIRRTSAEILEFSSFEISSPLILTAFLDWIFALLFFNVFTLISMISSADMLASFTDICPEASIFKFWVFKSALTLKSWE